MADLLKVSILGQLPGGEVWSINPVFRIGPPGDIITSAEAVAIVNGVNAITVPTGVRNVMSSNTLITGVRLEARFLDGSLEIVSEGARATPIGGTGLVAHPYQNALVTSLRTNTPGAAGRGRLYVPATGVTLQAASLRLLNTDVTSYVTGMRTYLTAIDTAIETALGPVNAQLVVWSRKGSSTAVVNRLQMGDVIDTQRRRRDTLFETYQEVSYPT